VEHTDAAHAAVARAAMDRLTSAPQGPERGQAHREFHGALISACPNRRLLGICASLFESSELHRHWSAAALQRPAHKGGRHQDVEHRAILAAVVAGEADLAVELHLQHLQRTVELALAYVAFRDGEAEPAVSDVRRNRRSTA
jgi:DNA-binding GntR family transcriptional regulator